MLAPDGNWEEGQRSRKVNPSPREQAAAGAPGHQSQLPAAFLEVVPFPGLGGWGGKKMPPGLPSPWSGTTYLNIFHIYKHLLWVKCFGDINGFNWKLGIIFYVYFNQQGNWHIEVKQLA